MVDQPPLLGTDPRSPLRVVLDGVPAMVAFWDKDLRNVVANGAYVEYFGVTPEAMTGMHIRDLLGERLFQANRPYLEAALRGEEQLFDRTLIDENGQTRYTQASYVPHWEDGEVTGLVVLVTDVTERRRAEQLAQRNADQYRALAKGLPDGFVLLFDRDLRFMVAEGAALHVFGYESGELEGRSMQATFPPALAAELEPRYRAALEGRPSEWERSIEGRTFLLKAGPVTDEHGSVFAGMVVAHDVTRQRRTQEIMSALRDTATSVARHLPTEVVASQIAEAVTRIFAVDIAAVVQFDRQDEGAILAMSPTPSVSSARRYNLTDNEWLAVARVAQTGEPSIAQYVGQPGEVATALRAQGLLAGAAAPIRFGEGIWGAVSLSTSTPAQLTEDTLASLAGFAELLEIALGNLMAWSSLSTQAAHDPLTDVPNRRSFDEHLERELAEGARSGKPLSVILIDIDHFKTVNDGFGHRVGDRILVQVAQLLTSAARRSELIARIGGEEFAWVLPDTDTAEALQAAERLRRTVSEHHFDPVGSVTISLGVCATTEVAAEALLEPADRALYRAKARGRNRSVAYGRED